MAAAAALFAEGLVPGSPSLEMSFEIADDVGKVTGVVTAPVNDSQWAALADTVRMDIRIVRSCYALEETDCPVITFEDLAPGESRTFIDNADPAWQYGYFYTYNAYASIDGNEGYQGYGSMQPGVSFSFAYGSVTATSVPEGDSFTVDISAVVPDKTGGYPAEPIPVDMTALEFYRVTSDGNVLLGTVDNPEKGETYHYVDKTPTVNSRNAYLVKCVSKFGFAESQTEVYVGLDVPSAPYPVITEAVDGGYKISWTAPTTGMNYGSIDTEQTRYNVYRCWGRAEDEREKIADAIDATEYVDYGTDMEFPRAVSYLVEALNNVGVGGSSSAPFTYSLLIGPAYRLPFVDTFDGGFDKVWSFENTSYYASWGAAEYAVYGDNDERVNPVDGTGLAYVDFSSSWIAAGSEATMSSYKIDMSKAVAPWLSFQAYMIPGCGIELKPQVSVNGDEYADLAVIALSDTTNAGWKKFNFDLSAYAGKYDVSIRFDAAMRTPGGAAIIDAVKVLDYPAVTAVSVEYNPDGCEAVLSWEDPSTEYCKVTGYEGFVDGESVGAVSEPWIYKAPEYKTPYVITVKALYDGIVAPASTPVTISVPRPEFTEFTLDEHRFTIVQGTPFGVHNVIIAEYLGSSPLYTAPEMMNYDDVTYTVVGIADDAYAGNTALTSVNLSPQIAEIGKGAFENCTSLRAISFGKALSAIGSRAFAGCSKLSSVIFTSETVPDVADDAFEGISNPCAGKCPEGMEDEYAASKGLAPIDFKTSGVGGIYADGEGTVEIYTLDGVRVSNPAKGEPVIIRRVSPDGKVTVSRRIVK